MKVNLFPVFRTPCDIRKKSVYCLMSHYILLEFRLLVHSHVWRQTSAKNISGLVNFFFRQFSERIRTSNANFGRDQKFCLLANSSNVCFTYHIISQVGYILFSHTYAHTYSTHTNILPSPYSRKLTGRKTPTYPIPGKCI